MHSQNLKTFDEMDQYIEDSGYEHQEVEGRSDMICVHFQNHWEHWKLESFCGFHGWRKTGWDWSRSVYQKPFL